MLSNKGSFSKGFCVKTVQTVKTLRYVVRPLYLKGQDHISRTYLSKVSNAVMKHHELTQCGGKGFIFMPFPEASSLCQVDTTFYRNHFPESCECPCLTWKLPFWEGQALTSPHWLWQASWKCASLSWALSRLLCYSLRLPDTVLGRFLNPLL